MIVVGTLVSSANSNRFQLYRYFLKRVSRNKFVWEKLDEVPTKLSTSLGYEQAILIAKRDYNLPIMRHFMDDVEICACLPVLALITLHKKRRLENRNIMSYFENISCNMMKGHDA